MQMMSWILDCRPSMIQLLHKLLFKFIIIFHPILIVMKLLMIIWIEIIFIEIVLITIKLVLMLSLWSRSSIFSNRGFLVLASVLLMLFTIIIIFLLIVMLVDNTTRASESLTRRSGARTIPTSP
jgi:hypothetical protein